MVRGAWGVRGLTFSARDAAKHFLQKLIRKYHSGTTVPPTSCHPIGEGRRATVGYRMRRYPRDQENPIVSCTTIGSGLSAKENKHLSHRTILALGSPVNCTPMARWYSGTWVTVQVRWMAPYSIDSFPV